MNEKPTKKRIVKNVILLTVALLAVGGYYYLKHSRILVKGHDYYAYFADVQGLQMSSPVMIKGVRVGKISDIDLGGRNVKLTITVKKEIQLPEGTVAKLASGGITGDKMIDLKPGGGPAILAEYSTLQTGIDTSLLPVSVRFTPFFETAKFMLRTADTTLQGFNELFSTGLLSRTTMGVLNLEQKMHGMSTVSAKLNNETDLHAVATNANAQSRELAAAGDDFNNAVDNAEKSSAKLAKTKIDDDVASFGASVKRLGASFHKLDTSMSGFGKLLNDNNNYHSISNSFDTLNRNWQQLQKAPPGISIFGGKKKK